MRTIRLIGALLAASLVFAGLASARPDAAGSEAGGKLTIGFVTHVKGNPFIQQIVEGARTAARDLGVTLKVAGPEGFDPDAQLKLVQDLVATGADGVATSVPGESMAKGLNDIIRSGTPIVQFNLLSKAVNGPYVGERSTQSGRVLGNVVLFRLAALQKTSVAKVKGKAVIGICAPGLPVLENRARGVKEALKKATGLKVVGPFDVKVDPTENFARWQQLLAANPDTKAMIGLCAPDVASLGKLNAQNGDKIVAGGYDTTAENLAAISRGHAYTTLGQMPFVQGYLPVLMLVDHLRKGTALKKGFFESGSEVVTKARVRQPYGLPQLTLARFQAIAASLTQWRSFYRPIVKSVLAKWATKLEPIANEGR